MGTKNILNVQHDFWKEKSKHKRMLLASVHLHEKRSNYTQFNVYQENVSFTHTIESNSSSFDHIIYACDYLKSTITFDAVIE